MVMCCSDSFASRARNRVAVEQLVTIPDDAGGRREEWSLLSEVFAIIEPKAGQEVYVNGQLQSRVDAVITIRFISDLSDTRVGAKSRVKFGDRLYNIRAVRNVSHDMKTEGRAYQMLICMEGEPT